MLDEMKRIKVMLNEAIGANQIVPIHMNEEDGFLPRFAWTVQFENVASDKLASYEIPFLSIMTNILGGRSYRRDYLLDRPPTMKILREGNDEIFQRPEMGFLKQFFERVDRFGLLAARASEGRKEFTFNGIETEYYYRHIHLSAIFASDYEKLMSDGNIKGVRDIYIEFSSDIPLAELAERNNPQAVNVWASDSDVTDLEKRLIGYMIWKMNFDGTWRKQ